PAAALPTAAIAGISTTETLTPGPSPSASAARMSPTNGNGGVAFIQDQAPVKSAGTAATFDDARANFGGAWKIFFANRTDANFGAWREQQDSTTWKYAMWDSAASCRLR